MEDCVNRLLEILRQMVSVFDRMRALSLQKKEALIKNDINTINDIVKDELELASRLNELEKKRQDCVAEIGEAIGVEGKTLSLGDIIEKVDGSLKQDLRDCFEHLKAGLPEQKKLNDINERLISSGMSYVNFMVNILSGNRNDNLVYNRKGHAELKAKGKSLFENKA